MPVKVQVIFYSMYGHLWKMAEAVAEGARQAAGAQVDLFQVAETLPADILAKMGATDAKKAFAHIPIASPGRLPEADAILFGSPTRYGSAAAQMQAFFDSTGQLWATGALIGKVGGAFTSTASQHGGQETTILSMYTFLLHQGMLVAGVPYSNQELLTLTEITGGSPYGASTIAGPKGERMPSGNELAIARAQGKHAAEIAAKLFAK
jgi:NAD(P)H dehydrogenase (quinone)